MIKILGFSNFNKKFLLNLFTVDNVDKLKKVLELYFKVFNIYKENKNSNSEIVLSPVFGKGYSIESVREEGLITIPNSILLLLRRPRQSNPFDLSHFRYDAQVWLRRLQRSSSRYNNIIPIFIYDVVHLFNTLVEYIPLILVNNETSTGKNISTCCHIDICSVYLEHHDDLAILLNLWYSTITNKFLDLVNWKINTTASKVWNPLFNSNPFSNRDAHCIDQLFSLDTTAKVSNIDKLLIEFTTSYATILLKNANVNSYAYVWFPIPSSTIIASYYEILKHFTTRDFLVIDIINNIAEFGSINPDRLWINTLKYIVKAQKVKAIIGFHNNLFKSQ